MLDSGARGGATKFVERGIGDVLIAWENEAMLAIKALGPDKVELVASSSSQVEPPVAVVDKVAERHRTRKVVQANVRFLYTDEEQEPIAKNYYRPLQERAAKKFSAQLATCIRSKELI